MTHGWPRHRLVAGSHVAEIEHMPDALRELDPWSWITMRKRQCRGDARRGRQPCQDQESRPAADQRDDTLKVGRAHDQLHHRSMPLIANIGDDNLPAAGSEVLKRP